MFDPLFDQGHVQLQMRDLFAMAMALNRTVILPRLVCYCDRYWGPLDECRVPGAMQTRLPFVCPLDHIFEPFHFDDDPKKFGPPVRFREHSFLDSQDTPNTIRKGVMLIPDRGHVRVPSGRAGGRLGHRLRPSPRRGDVRRL